MPSEPQSVGRSKRASRAMVWVTLAAMCTAVIFLMGHVWLIAISTLNPWEIAAMSLLIGCEFFMFFHSFAYFMNVAKVNARDAAGREEEPPPPLTTMPSAAFAVCSYKEPLAVIEANLMCLRNLTYPARQIYLLDDTPYDRPSSDPEALRKYGDEVKELCRRIGVNLFRHYWREAKAGMINDFRDHLAGRPREGFELFAFQPGTLAKDVKYLAVFDADMNPLPDFAEPLIAHLEADDRVAFVQTPQFYSNTLTNRVAQGAALQQAVFYEYICEGKGLQDVMPCCGTNVIFRLAALEDVGGMDETSVTEDFATSIRLHLRGWRSKYVKHICAFGMGPQDLGAFFKQQFRWALGTVGLLRLVLKFFLKNPRALPLHKWLEYFTSVSYYCMGWVWVIIWAFPALYLLFGFPKTLARIDVFFALFAPYLFFTFWAFIGSLRNRGYSTWDVFAGLMMNVISFPIYIKASALGLAGTRSSFKVTPKEGANSLPLYQLWPQLLVFSLMVLTSVWGLNHLFYGTLSPAAVFGNVFWCAYNGAMLYSVLYFNNPEGKLRHTRAA